MILVARSGHQEKKLVWSPAESMYVVKLSDGRLVRRHADHVRKTDLETEQTVEPDSAEELLRDLPQMQAHQDHPQDPPEQVRIDENPEQNTEKQRCQGQRAARIEILRRVCATRGIEATEQGEGSVPPPMVRSFSILKL